MKLDPRLHKLPNIGHPNRDFDRPEERSVVGRIPHIHHVLFQIEIPNAFHEPPQTFNFSEAPFPDVHMDIAHLGGKTFLVTKLGELRRLFQRQGRMHGF